MTIPILRAGRIASFGLTTPDIARLGDFYMEAFGCRRLLSERLEGPDFERLMQVKGGAQREVLMAGQEIIELLEFDHPGAPHPLGTAFDRSFQHFALVVGDMQIALRRLERVRDWTPISDAGPQRLPASSGGVTAFKFRDPDGHPLEFLEFPRAGAPTTPGGVATPGGDAIIGIDHSAISIAGMAESVAFYRELGFAPSTHTLNQGPEQSALDGIPEACVEVMALTPQCPAPHLELLCYRTDSPRGAGAAAANDVAATRITIDIDHPASPDGAPIVQRLMRDPDGHRLIFL
jgi:catechol 2,3-dioxygenase-like lactoylglutathione lyase family enzyme